MFAEAINSRAHLLRFTVLSTLAGYNATEAIEEIERNIEWVDVKGPEIALWAAGGTIHVKTYVITITAFVLVMLFK